MSAGVDGCAIYRGDDDRRLWIGRFAKTLARFEWESIIFCLLTTHFHMMIRTHEPNLARGMQWLNSGYAQGFNERHGRFGPLLRGRYVAVQIESDEQYAVTWTYIAYNPVRAGLCPRPQEWPWLGVAPGRPLPDWDVFGV
jgi:hypothetical protein